ncbi:MAG: HD domain-containing protein [Erysipelotrichaceae bacterium]|nr:HD domain-containing protein [Erysipelotrichaceae bacterium]
MKDKIIKCAFNYIEDLFKNDFGGHDVEHSKRVYQNALLIAKCEPECDLFVVSLAALLHDVDDHKLFHTENNANARAFLESVQLDQNQIDRICELMNGISFSKNRGVRPETLEGKIVQDADRLDAIGAIGIARTFAFGGERKRPLSATVQHFYDKLLLLKDEMNTAEGKRIAEHRHQLMVDFLQELNNEMHINETE